MCVLFEIAIYSRDRFESLVIVVIFLRLILQLIFRSALASCVLSYILEPVEAVVVVVVGSCVFLLSDSGYHIAKFVQPHILNEKLSRARNHHDIVLVNRLVLCSI